MSEVKKIATRESYGNALAELGAEFDNLVVLDADLAAATKTGIFKKAFPERHIDCGHGKLHPKIVQQQSAVAVACNKEKPAVFHSPAQPEQIRPPPPRPNRAQNAFELLFHRIPQRFLTAYHTTATAQMQSGRTCKEPCGAVK